jgi:AraC-like DNA-binding protein
MSPEWTDTPRGCEGIELLQASFHRHVYDRHMHDAYAIGVTLRGVQRFWCRGAIHDSTPGHVIVIRPGEVHDGRSGAAGGYTYRMLYVMPEIVHAIADDAGGRRADLDVSGPLVPDRAVFDLLNAGWAALAHAPQSLASDELLLRGVSALALRQGASIDAPAREHDRALNHVRDYLRANLERSVTMRELATIASMSRFQLTRRFQQRYGLPVHGYLRHLRLEEAKRRLARGHEIASVAVDLGFVDQSHFHRRFRGSFGVTPGQWRAAHGYKTRRPRAGYREQRDGQSAGRSQAL